MFLNQLLMIGTSELLLVAGIALLLFGGKKLPEMMKGLGEGVRSFKDAVNGNSSEQARQPVSKNKEEESATGSKGADYKEDSNHIKDEERKQE